MSLGQPAKLLRIHCSESDRYKGKPLYEAIVAKCRQIKIAGATVFRDLEGFGVTAEIHRTHLLVHDQPIVITIVDSAENLASLIPAIEEMMDTGIIAMSDVEVKRIQNGGSSPLFPNGRRSPPGNCPEQAADGPSCHPCPQPPAHTRRRAGIACAPSDRLRWCARHAASEW